MVVAGTSQGIFALDPPAAPDAAQPDRETAGGPSAALSWEPGSPEHKRLRALVSHAGFLILRLRSYPAWRVQVNGRPPVSLPRRGDDLIVVPVAQGPVDLTVDWVDSWDAVAGRWLSGVAVLVLTGLWLWERKHSRARLS